MQDAPPASVSSLLPSWIQVPLLLGDDYSSSYIFDPFQSLIEHALPCLLYKLSPYNSSHGNHEIV